MNTEDRLVVARGEVGKRKKYEEGEFKLIVINRSLIV